MKELCTSKIHLKSYTFDFGRKAERTPKEVDTKINSAILKAE